MAIKLSDQYPGRANPPSVDYPNGSVKNRSAPQVLDGTPLDQAWANDDQGFKQSILHAAGITANGQVDKVGASQYFDALIQLIQKQESGVVAFTSPGTVNWTVPAELKSGQKKVKVIVTGGGGGGAAGATGERGGGGGAGATVIALIDLSGVSEVTITVGAGGQQGEYFQVDGQPSLPGFSSSFGTYATAVGGGAGQPPAGLSGGGGGYGGSTGAGGLLLRGGEGGDGNPIEAAIPRIGAGSGGASFWGGGSSGRIGAIESGVYGAPGSGGGGGSNRTKGGVGADGIVYLEW